MMGLFQTCPGLIPRPNRLWELAGPLRFKSNRYGLICVPKGFVTDLASVPRLLWAYLPPFGNYTRSAVIHDALYTFQQINGQPITRKIADRILNEAMGDDDTGNWERNIIFIGVRLGGWLRWHQAKRALKRNMTLQKGNQQ